MAYQYVTRSILVPAQPVAVISHDGEAVKLDFTKLTDDMLGTILYEGALRVLRDCKAGKDAADSFAATGKRVDAWMNGSFTILDRAGSDDKWLFIAYRELVENAQGKMTDAGFNKHRLDMVGKPSGVVKWNDFAIAWGKARAKAKGETKTADELAEALSNKCRPRAEEMRDAERATLAKVDIAGLDLF